MGLNLRTLEQKIAAVKHFGEKVLIPENIDWNSYDYTNDIFYPITVAPAKVVICN